VVLVCFICFIWFIELCIFVLFICVCDFYVISHEDRLQTLPKL